MMCEHVPRPGAVTPATVRRGLAHIDAHAHLPLQLGDIGVAAGTSARPAVPVPPARHHALGYLRRSRPELARHELQGADPTRGDTVAAVATRWGFADPRRFATAYRQAFGVLPGQDPPSLSPRTPSRRTADS